MATRGERGALESSPFFFFVRKKIKEEEEKKKKNAQIKQSQEMKEGPNLHRAWRKRTNQRFWARRHYCG